MKIGIVTSPLKDDNATRGVGKYTRLLIDSLNKYNQDVELITEADVQKLRGRVELLHYPFFDPFLLTLPYHNFCPTVVTVHDLIPIIYKEHFAIGLRGWLKWLVQKRSLQNVNQIMTVSESSRQEIAKALGRQSNVSVIYSYASENYRLMKEIDIASVKKKYKLPARYLLYVGDINWNKNIGGMLRIFASVKKDSRFADVKLVLVGKAFGRNEITEAIEINRLIAELNLQSEVIKSGFVPEEDLPAVYGGAAMYLQLSWAEGFGLPVIEAMSSGTIVVTSNRGGLREISGPGYMVDPDNINEAASQIIQVLQFTKEERKTAILRNLGWVKQFNSRMFSQQVVECYEKTLARN